MKKNQQNTLYKDCTNRYKEAERIIHAPKHEKIDIIKKFAKKISRLKKN